AMRPVVLGFPDLAAYVQSPAHMGAVVGRVANRISDARFSLEGQTDALPATKGGYCLHGGPRGFAHRVWQGEPDTTGTAVRLSLRSEDGDMGFPGTVEVVATWRLEGHRLSLALDATADRRTPLSLVQHLYFNLGTGPDVLDHRLKIAASAFTPNSDALMPTGAILPVSASKWDFRQPRSMRDHGGAPVAYDGNLVLDAGRDIHMPVVEARPPEGDLVLRLWTDRPGVQLYNSPFVTHGFAGHDGRRYGPFSGFCLEDQNFPDALSHLHFPSILHGPDRPYSHRCAFEIAPVS
ncbi:MAG: aldose epimerase family protein, partial [Devosia sp.]